MKLFSSMSFIDKVFVLLKPLKRFIMDCNNEKGIKDLMLFFTTDLILLHFLAVISAIHS